VTEERATRSWARGAASEGMAPIGPALDVTAALLLRPTVSASARSTRSRMCTAAPQAAAAGGPGAAERAAAAPPQRRRPSRGRPVPGAPPVAGQRS
jgi:hypothetical protein